ncbi:methyltransferase type 11 [Halobacteriales archaeon QS_1_68_20]|nr:MAG: methyltransferase type 11 [Halobacteriales archaeon QS_1_68_20]
MAGGDLWFFDRVAPAYDRFMFGADAAAIRAGFAVADRPVRRVVDVAGGTGRGLAAVAPEEGMVVDASLPMLRRAHDQRIASAAGDAGRLPLADESVDAVMIVDAFHHLPDSDAALSEAARVVRPGGVVVLREFDPSTLRGRAIEVMEHLVRFDSTFFTPAEALERLEAAGLRGSVPDGGWGYTAAGVKPGGPDAD